MITQAMLKQAIELENIEDRLISILKEIIGNSAVDDDSDINIILKQSHIGYNGAAAEFLDLLGKEFKLPREELLRIKETYAEKSITVSNVAYILYDFIHTNAT